MAIGNKYSGNGAASKGMNAGEHRVKITAITVKDSKAGKPMITVEFVNEKGQTHSSFFVMANDFAMTKFKDLRESCGLEELEMDRYLLGKKCGMALEPGKPNAEGKIYMQVSGYGKESEVAGGSSPAAKEPGDSEPDEDSVPF